jgi:hypothetical protein
MRTAVSLSSNHGEYQKVGSIPAGKEAISGLPEATPERAADPAGASFFIDQQHTPSVMKQPQYYFSRNYVEFGAFSPEEIADFCKRGILAESDYVRSLDSENWETVSQWLANGVTPKAAKPKTAGARKKAATATKSSKKAA